MDQEQQMKEAVAEAIRLSLTRPPTIFPDPPVEEAQQRAFDLGATWADFHAEEPRQREALGMQINPADRPRRR
ncbi:hypothetical protein [Streptomyces qinglanensis]|uniref:Uncharacterized protein n=1 Tax=Streptomyces qinglanensis TaxID=943816 RepID=A0A1H9U3L4_9ACTN|nr:hypothetical protein [Streptomyces qinglanensis]SES03747.1 hypothetical protein SAMN05421870_107268 [Streptomyces qinglanensis]